ncbi:Ankyrin repeat domain-containing protein 50 [Trichoderma lentiforme]|uniref:Ankyrin repeat domain-containing protein 50 n=1 Tax=Trichoderma lentiforme TaxID=1567552 RepID=A0A9P5C9E3_9HYPO|nr:Ankyrin repeat domain-containing protein 50 [Trichoderma lentiforme]
MPDDHTPPSSRHEFKIAILCALPLEASVLQGLFDARWDAEKYGKEQVDTNAYSLGVLGPHNVVLVHMPNMGKVAAAAAATNLRASFRGIQLALVVGICGGAPFGPSGELLLGDVVISEGLIQYDLGRRLPNTFVRKDTPGENLPRPGPEVRAILAKLQTNQNRQQLQREMLEYLRLLRQRPDLTIPYPGLMNDRLFKPRYLHRHRPPSECAICSNVDGEDLCCSAMEASCEELECSKVDPRPRSRIVHTSDESQPIVHFGLVATGDTVMRSGKDRDRIIARDKVIAFEMEGSGVWEAFPAALVIKGVCDYADSHKNKTWQPYAAATAAAATKAILQHWEIRTDLPQHLQEISAGHMKTRRFETRELEIMKRLNTSPYRDRKERNPDRVAGTCEWFIKHVIFQDWKESASSRLLWVSADPGCGKSVLVKYLVDSIIFTTTKTTVCYFFFKDDFEDQKSITSALCCVLYQIFQQNPALLTEAVVNQIETGGERFLSSFSDLWHILLIAAQDVHAGEIICILDAIDECEELGRSQLAKALCKLYGPESRLNLKLKFLVTSRPFGNIRQGFQPLQVPGMPIIHLSGESEEEMKKIAAEIDIYIRARVEDIGERLKLDQYERHTLLEQLIRVPNRTYLWVYLTLDLIENDINIDKAGILQATTHIPKTVDEAYNRILSKSYDPRGAIKILHIIVAAERALSLEELGFALSIRRHHRSYDDIGIKREDRLRENIRDTCGLFVTITHSRVYLLHQTAREFLVRDTQLLPTDYINPDLEWKHILLPHESHKTLAKICISCLHFWDRETNHFVEYYRSESTNSCILFNYSANYWVTHLRESHTKINGPIARSIWKLCNVNSRLCECWLSVFWKKTSNTTFPEQFTTLMVVSYFGLDAMVKIILSTIADDDELNARDGTYGRSALSWAAGNGFDDVVKLLARGRRSWRRKLSLLLFGNPSEINSVDASDRTPLLHAIWNGNLAVVKTLLKAGARLDVTDIIGGTPLFYAMSYRREAIVKLLLEHGATPISENKMATELFFSAVEKDDVQVVQLFLDSGFDIESRGRDNQTPLSLALEMGHRDVLQVLLDQGANIEVKDEFGLTPLHSAVVDGDVDQVQFFVNNGADLDPVDPKNKTPLLSALELGHRDILKILLDHGADIEIRDKRGLTVLHYAVQFRDFDLVQLFLAKGVYIDLTDDRKHMPLHHAIISGDINLLQSLLDNGANIESVNINGHTPLHYAVISRRTGYMNIIRLLLDKKADINSVDAMKRTPLSYAIESKITGLIRLLVERGADAKLLHEEEQVLIYVHQHRLLYIQEDFENSARPRLWGEATK